MTPRAILFVHHANDLYGADYGLLHSVMALNREQYDPIVLLPADTADGMLSQELDRLGIEYHIAPLGILRRKYLSARRIVPLAIEFARGVAYVHSMARCRGVAMVYVNTIVAPSGAIGGKLAGAPVLWHIREILSMPRPIRWVLQKTMRLCASQVICVSHAVRDALLAEASSLRSKSAVLYNAVPPGSQVPPGNQLRQEMGIPENAPVIGTVGRITHWKGQEILVEAAVLVLRSFSDAHFIAVGSYFADESHYLDSLESRIAQLGLTGRFHLTGYRRADASLYRAFDIFVLPSRKPEPFGRVTVEAMLQERPVIATNHGGTPELIQDGITGILVPPSDPEALAHAIEKLLGDSSARERMGKAAAEHARQRFSVAVYEEQVRNIVSAFVPAS